MLGDSGTAELPTLSDGARPAMVDSSSIFGPAQDADHVPSQSASFVFPLRRHSFGKPVAGAAPGLASFAANLTQMLAVAGD